MSAVDSGNAELEFPAEGALQISHRTEVEACARQANSGKAAVSHPCSVISYP